MYNQDYQEDINLNPFFKALKRSKLYVNVERNCWLVCVPQISSLSSLKITQDILDVHVLQPSPYFQGEYITANNKTVTVEDGSITIANDLREHRTAKILFEETFYTKESKSFRVLCVDSPLAGEIKKIDGTAVQLPSTRSLPDISHFLHSFPINSIVLSKVHEQIEELGRTYVLVKGFEDHAVGKAKALSVKALEDLVCANPDFRYLYENDHLTNELSLVVESYVVGALYPILFPALKAIFVQEDVRIRDNLIIWRGRNVAKELGLKPDLVPHVAHITPHLQRMQSCHTPLEKLWCVQEGLDAAAFAVSISRTSDNTLGADDTLPLLIAAVIEAAPPNLHTTLYFVQNFVFSKIAASSLGYQLVNLQAAIQFVRGEDKEDGNAGEVGAPADTAATEDASTATPWHPVHPVGDAYKNRYSTSFVTDYQKAGNTSFHGDEILAYLTKGVSDSPAFTPHRYTSSTRSVSSMNLKDYEPNEPYKSTSNNSSYNSSYNGNNNSNNKNNSSNRNNRNEIDTNLINNNGYSSSYSAGQHSFYRPSKAYSSPTNPLTTDNYQHDWHGANAPPKPSASPPLGSRSVSEMNFRSTPQLHTTPIHSSSSSLASRSTPSFTTNSRASVRNSVAYAPQSQPTPSQYKRPPSVIKLDGNLGGEEADSGGGFLAQLRKLGDDGVSSSQFSRW